MRLTTPMQSAEGSVLSLRLYVAGVNLNSLAAQHNITQIVCGIPHELEIIDVAQTPHRALADGVWVTPMLVRLRPQPQLTIAGSLALHEHVLKALMTT